MGVAAIFSAALVAALAVTGARRLRHARARRRRQRWLAATPGASAAHPMVIASYADIDDAVEGLRCPCGGLLEKIGEGTRGAARVVRCTCVICEEDLDLFFDLSAIRH